MSDRDDRFASPCTTRLRVMRDGQNIIRSARIPKPVVLVDTREQIHPAAGPPRLDIASRLA